MKFKAIITDLDRTLLKTDKSISEKGIDTIRKLKKKGILFMAATARPYRSITEYDSLLGFDGAVCLNGAEIRCKDKIFSNGIDRKQAEGFLEALLINGKYTISAEINGILYANDYFPQWESVYYTDFPFLPDGIIHKILVTYTATDYEFIKSILPDDLYCTIANRTLIQIMDKNANKLNGITKMLSMYGIDISESVYFGDDHDDIPPIINCGLGVAVENAIEQVKSAADIVVSSNENDGVTDFIMNHILKD